MYGYVKNFNTLQDFKAADKQAYFYQIVDDIWAAITNDTSRNTLATASDPNCFLLLTYADLKSYKYYYWFAFPALLTQSPGWILPDDAPEWRPADQCLSQSMLVATMIALHDAPGTVSCFVSFNEESARFWSLADGRAYLDATPADKRLLLFVDPSPHEQYPGWPLRNILTCIHVRLGLQTIRVLCWRDMFEVHRTLVSDHTEKKPTWRSVLGMLMLPDEPTDGIRYASRNTHLVPRPHTALPDAVGWERNIQGKLAPKLVSLGAMLDPRYLADRAVDLNLKLMRWRVMPNLALETIQSADALLIGAGTLGCNVARTLLGWGVRKVTFVDNGRVSYSNPVRQSLFSFDDCLNGGKWKAYAAAEALRRIFPGVQAEAHVLSVPMPGHPVPPASVRTTLETITALEELVAQHDVVFVLTDSREARWLPSLLGAVKNKLVINAALGYDSYVVMRHGVFAPDQEHRAGCYFCSDVVAPANSMNNRTLDQMCTVTRPGLAGIAAATAVELMVSVLQHPLGAAAPPPPPQRPGQGSALNETELGLVPQQIRGYLANFTTLTVSNYAFAQCTACSPAVIAAYEYAGSHMVLEACNDSAYLEHLSHLDELKHQTDALELELDWSDEEAQGLQ